MKYVAVVMTADEISLKSKGDFACFVDRDKHVEVTKAIKAANEWQDRTYAMANGRKYWVAVGTLTEVATEPVKYELYPLEEVDDD